MLLPPTRRRRGRPSKRELLYPAFTLFSLDSPIDVYEFNFRFPYVFAGFTPRMNPPFPRFSSALFFAVFAFFQHGSSPPLLIRKLESEQRRLFVDLFEFSLWLATPRPTVSEDRTLPTTSHCIELLCYAPPLQYHAFLAASHLSPLQNLALSPIPSAWAFQYPVMPVHCIVFFFFRLFFFRSMQFS